MSKYRVITRSDLDGVVCATLLKEIDLIDDVKFAHPKDLQDGTVEITPRDIITNLPYNENAHLVLDHHASEITRNQNPKNNMINNPSAPSAAYVVYHHYGPEKFKNISHDLMEATHKVDSANLTLDDILNPKDWILLGFLMDSRTGLGRFRDFRISNYQLMMDLVDILRTHKNIDEILAQPDVAERVNMYRDHSEKAKEQMKRLARYDGKMVTIDLRDEKEIYTTNRFMIYALFPDANVTMHVMHGRQNVNTVFAVGKSILNRTANIHVGNLMLEYGGGGHKAVGTCQIDNDKAEAVKEELIKRIVADA